MSRYIHKSHNVTVLLYHLVFPAKYRRAVIDATVDQVLREVCLEIEVRYQLKFLEIGTERYRDNTEMREPMLLMQANALFTTGRYPEAGAVCQDYLTDFPAGKFAEEARYLSAMTVLALGEASASARLMHSSAPSWRP